MFSAWMVEGMPNYRLRSCVWEITRACCFSCKYCGSKAGIARGNELSTEECLDVVRQLAELSCQRVSLIGGEVFMRKDWNVIAKALTNYEIRTAIITNGFLFSERLIEQMLDCEIESVAVSLDGPEMIHDKYRQQGSYRRAIKAIETLAEHGILVSVITTLNSENAELLEAFYEILRALPVAAWQIQACSPMGNAAGNGIEYRFDMKSVIRFISAHAFEAPFMMGIADNIGYYTEEEGMLRGNLSGKAVFDGCRAGLAAIGIDSAGNVRGCESMYDDRFNEGNLREISLKEIWESPDAFRYNRGFDPSMLTGECAACAYGKVCAGGCRSYNYFVHGKLYESPFCARTRNS
ncbi:MAG: radical SAM protein [Lachnospiraceae bacterium]|nr:radical SAM protein [Lachnospiraceae bacterium]